MRVIGGGAFRHLFHIHNAQDTNDSGDGDDDDDDEATQFIQSGSGYFHGGGWRRRRRRGVPTFEKVPSDVGRDLMNSGHFGSCERNVAPVRKKKLAYRLMRRELGLGSQGTQNTVDRLIAQVCIDVFFDGWVTSPGGSIQTPRAGPMRLKYDAHADRCVQSLIPSSAADLIIHYDRRCYSGQFSDDGNFFFSCAQDFRVRMYDTSNPYNWQYYKV
jgi:DDB1- and CUL4-associated factor 11